MSASEQDMTFSDFSKLYLWNMTARTEVHPGFHMPGHAGARFFTKDYSDALISIDTTELTSSDDLHDPCGPALFAMKESSRIYGSGETLFVTTGSTTGIQVMLASVLSPDTFLLLPRTVHMSVLHAIALLDCKYAFITCQETGDRSAYMYPQLSQDALTDALESYPQATDVLLVSPDYYGQCADLRKLAETAHSHGCRLLVDEAHGSHFSFSKDLFPPDAMTSGADMCVQSLHKTLPALTMAAQIHISAEAIRQERVSVPRVWEMLRLFETSSPSFVIAASSEYALAWMDRFGSPALSDRIVDISNFLARIGPVLGQQSQSYGTPGQADPLHMVLFPDPDLIIAPDLMTALENRGIHVEFADLLRLVLIISPWHKKKDFDDLYDAVSDCVAQIPASQGRAPRELTGREGQVTDKLWGTLLTSIPQKAVSVRSAFFGGHGKTSIDISQSEGKICAATIAPYPPGIAILWPGERISEVHIDVLLRLKNFGITVRGMHMDKIDVLLE